MIGAGILTYPHGANRHSFHGAGQRTDGDQSPVFIPFSNWINMPVIMSLTVVCAPNEMASPNAPAPASSGAMFTPISESRIITVMVLITTASALRNSVSSVRARALGSGRP